MGITRIRQVKREIRLLGIAVKPSRSGDRLHAVGVVFRGGLWLDGVMRTTASAADLTERLVEMITASPHHPQIRVLLLCDILLQGEASVDPYRLSTGTSRPVLVISTEGTSPTAAEEPPDVAARRFELRLRGALLSVLAVGLGRRDAEKVLKVSTREDSLPEALRVAGLVASAVAA